MAKGLQVRAKLFVWNESFLSQVVQTALVMLAGYSDWLRTCISKRAKNDVFSGVEKSCLPLRADKLLVPSLTGIAGELRPRSQSGESRGQTGRLPTAWASHWCCVTQQMTETVPWRTSAELFDQVFWSLLFICNKEPSVHTKEVQKSNFNL